VERYALPQGEGAAASQSIPGDNVRISLQGGDTIDTAMLIGADGFRSAFIKIINKIQYYKKFELTHVNKSFQYRS
jgi:2-polyprenyl-6-methoxyphenol hydroxylase-like FAD-dependent oxidoreductase